MNFHHSELQARCEDEVRKCDSCQRHKNVGRGHGETASREAPLLPWQDVAIDLIGPWTLSIGDQKLKFSALTMIDMVTNLVEVVRISNKTAAHIGMHFENTWLSRYPNPRTSYMIKEESSLGMSSKEGSTCTASLAGPLPLRIPRLTRSVRGCIKQ
jgi:hypothetical protein